MTRQTLSWRDLMRRWRRDDRGVSAVEFAIAAPFFVILYLGGYETTQAVTAYRKVTLTARTVADLTTQYTTMSAKDVSTVMNASAQVMSPFNTSALTIVLTEFQVPLLSVPVGNTISACVTWTNALNTTSPYVNSVVSTCTIANAKVTLPAYVCQPGSSVVLSTVSFGYLSAVAQKVVGTINMSDHLFMSPRQVSSIPYTG